MLNILKIATLLAAAASATIAAPTLSTRSNGQVTVTLENKCSNNLNVYKLDNGSGKSIESKGLGSGESTDYKLSSDWSGRFWGCREGEKGCDSYGAPVSLAEFLFNGYAGSDFYDISFVDGFNLPMSITPGSKSGSGYDCGAPTCADLPVCPDGLEHENGSCMSACAAFGTPEYCCTGEYNDPAKCKASAYAEKFKQGCADAYSYAYDDAKSTYACQDHSYTVTFCP